MSLAVTFEKHATDDRQLSPAEPQAGADIENPDISTLSSLHAGNAVLTDRELAYLVYEPGGDAASYRLNGYGKASDEEEDKEARKDEAVRRFLHSNAQLFSQMREDATRFLEQQIEKLDGDILTTKARLEALQKLQDALGIRLSGLRASRDEVQVHLTDSLDRANSGGRLCSAVHAAQCSVEEGVRESEAQTQMRGIVDDSLREPSADGKGALIIACKSSKGEIVDYYLVSETEARLLSELPEDRKAAAQELIDSYQHGGHSDREVHDLPDFIKTAMAAAGHGTIEAPHDEVVFLINDIQESLDEREALEEEIGLLEEDYAHNEDKIHELQATLEELSAKRTEAVNLLREIREKNLDGAELQQKMESSSFAKAWDQFMETSGAKEVVDMAKKHLPESVVAAAQTAWDTVNNLFGGGSPAEPEKSSGLQKSFAAAHSGAPAAESPEQEKERGPAAQKPITQTPGMAGV